MTKALPHLGDFFLFSHNNSQYDDDRFDNNTDDGFLASINSELLGIVPFIVKVTLCVLCVNLVCIHVSYRVIVGGFLV